MKNRLLLPHLGRISRLAPSGDVPTRIVTTVADYEDVLPTDLPPLEDRLGSETYQQLEAIENKLSEPLTFKYLFYDVTVLPDGEVIVTP